MKTKTESDLIRIEDPLIEPFFIVKEKYCYTIYERRKPEGGKEYNKALGHYALSNLGNVLKKLGEFKLGSSKSVYTLKEYIEENKRVNEETIELINKMIQ